jgi:hypothetical protein
MATPDGFAETTTTVSPDAFSQPFLEYGMQEAQRLYQTQTPEYYQGQTYAGFSPEQQMALDAQRQRALAGSGLTQGAQQFTQQALSGDFQSAALPYAQQLAGGVDYSEPMGMIRQTAQGGFLGGSPGLQGAIDRALDPVQARVQSSLARAGRTGSGAAADIMSRELGNVASNISYQDYGRERQNQLAAQQQLANLTGQQYESQLRGAGFLGDTSNIGFSRQAAAAQQAPAMADLDYSDISRLEDVGLARQQMGQQGINEAMDRYNYQQQLPAQQLAQYQNLVTGFPMGQTETKATPYFEPSAFEKALGGAAGVKKFTDNPYLIAGGGLLGGLS